MDEPEQVRRIVSSISFFGYIAAVLLLAVFSHQLLKKRSFLKEYFLGSRSLGLWTLAMTYAATSASGGSFTGFPALVYTHGWIVALWIASYMIVPVCCLGMLGKRLNQVARKSGAITLPDVFRDRFRSPGLGVASSLVLVFFLAFNLVAQFKAGALIVENLLDEFEWFQLAAERVKWIPDSFSFLSTRREPTYCLGLLMFAGAVIAYTVYGGFRAVVWTDVLQGVVMFFGVICLLFFTLAHVDGGLEGATRDLAARRLFTAVVAAPPGASAAVAVPENAPLVATTPDGTYGFTVELPFQVEPPSGPNDSKSISVRAAGDRAIPQAFPESTSFAWGPVAGGEPPPWREVTIQRIDVSRRDNLVSGPGFKSGAEAGFLPFALAFSFFMMWAISGAGQPTTMVRLMAFSSSKVLRRSIFTVTVYYSLIYIPIVIIFVCARKILPALERPDQAMSELVLQVAPAAVAGIILAAPFAAVMSTVDSFLLAIASGLVRDVYQRSINPRARPRTLRRLSYLTTLVIGVIVMIGAINPPEFLQHIIVLTSASLSCSFLAPMFLALYWKRMTAQGVYGGLIGGFCACFGLIVAGWLSGTGVDGYYLAGCLPLVWGMATSILLSVLGSLLSPPPPQDLVDFYFKAEVKKGAGEGQG